jgi:hypothetical protein
MDAPFSPGVPSVPAQVFATALQEGKNMRLL